MHAHPVWFLDGNPIVGYSKLKSCVRLLFWSGQSFDEPTLQNEGSFKAAEMRYTSAEQINVKDIKRWLKKAKDIQWDYKNIVKRKGVFGEIEVKITSHLNYVKTIMLRKNAEHYCFVQLINRLYMQTLVQE
ncbi:MAG: DUF1801 domain-containing protein [Ferruginibacter sp.]